MSNVYIPCLNVDAPDNGDGFSVGIAAGPGSEGGMGVTPGIEISHSDSPVTLIITPVYPYISFGINWKWWGDLFGLGETRIEREKEQIQDVLTPIFKYLHKGYGVPITDDHALQFPSDGVKKMFEKRPDLAALAPTWYQEAYPLAQSVFVDDTPSKGQRERIVNQYIANAAYNDWPLYVAGSIWGALLISADKDCRQDKGRWMKHPMLMEKVAQYSVLLQYMPLQNFASAVAEKKMADPQGRSIINHWLNNPQLVAGIQQIGEVPAWGIAYKSKEDGGGQSGNPYETQQIADREPIQELWQGITYHKPSYPDFIPADAYGLKGPLYDVVTADKPDDWDQTNPDNPWPGDNVQEIPPQPQGPQNWPQYPDCPPWNQQPQPDEGGGDQGDGEPDPQQPDGICDPDCQEQIDYLKERVLFIDNWLQLGLLARIENLEDWLTDIEHRVPGPQPALPNPNPYEPWLPQPPADPGDIPTEEEPPAEGSPCDFTEEECERLKKLADPEKLCDQIKKCDRELECKSLSFCDETGGPWGVMAECWLEKNTPPPDNVQGVYAERQYPAYAVQAMTFAWTRAYFQGQGGQGQAQGALPPVSEGSPQALAGTYAKDLFPKIFDSWKGATYTYTGPEPPLNFDIPWIYADPATEMPEATKIISVKPRPGEIDPCTGACVEFCEIPPAEEQP